MFAWENGRSTVWSRFAPRVVSAWVLLTLLASPAAAQPPEGQALAEVERVFADYEVIRAALARDDSANVAASARRIEARARGLRSSGGAVGTRMGEAATAAGRLARSDMGDLAALRRAFGELSRPLVMLLEEVPPLGAHRYVFECPMAEGYGRWIQLTEGLRNPYMGGRMLTCGRPVL